VLKETYSSGSYTESTIADGGLSWPTEIAVDGNGNVYFADYFNSRVLKETYSSAAIRRASSRPAARWEIPSGLRWMGAGTSIYPT